MYKRNSRVRQTNRVSVWAQTQKTLLNPLLLICHANSDSLLVSLPITQTPIQVMYPRTSLHEFPMYGTCMVLYCIFTYNIIGLSWFTGWTVLGFQNSMEFRLFQLRTTYVLIFAWKSKTTKKEVEGSSKLKACRKICY